MITSQEYEKIITWLRPFATEALSNIVDAFSIDRLGRIGDAITWTETVDNDELQYEITVHKTGSSGLRIQITVSLTRCDNKGVLLELNQPSVSTGVDL